MFGYPISQILVSQNRTWMRVWDTRCFPFFVQKLTSNGGSIGGWFQPSWKILVNGKDYHGLSSNILWKIKKCSKPPTSQLPSPFALSDTDLHRNPEQPEKRWDVGIDVGELPLWGVYKIEVPKMGYPVPPNHPKSWMTSLVPKPFKTYDLGIPNLKPPYIGLVYGLQLLIPQLISTDTSRSVFCKLYVGPPFTIAKLVPITPISLLFMVLQ